MNITGSAVIISSEVLVSYMIRMFLKAPKPILDMAFIHALSLPFLGGLQFTKPSLRTSQNDEDGQDNGYFPQLIAGAKGIPAVLLAQYCVSTFAQGFHVPWFNMYDLMITSASKALTAPLLYSVRAYLPNFIGDGLEFAEFLAEGQFEANRFADAKSAVQGKRGFANSEQRAARYSNDE